MNLTCLIFGVAFIAFGLLFFTGNGHIHLTAWQRMPAAEKKTIRIKPLCRNIGAVIIACGAVFLAGGLSASFKDDVFIFAMLGWFVCTIADIWYIEKSRRYLQ